MVTHGKSFEQARKSNFQRQLLLQVMYNKLAAAARCFQKNLSCLLPSVLGSLSVFLNADLRSELE